MRARRQDPAWGSALNVKPTLREYLAEGPFALAMSSGFFGFFAHTGVLTVLEDEELLPSRVSGSSAGALVTASWASGLDAPVLAGELAKLERADFWDPSVGPGLLRGRLFRSRLEQLLPRRTFEECRVPSAVSVFDVVLRKTHVIDRGEIARAVHASCAVPFMFHPVWIGNRAYLDGGILDRPGLDAMPADESRVLFHHLASKSPWRTKLHMPKRPGMITLNLGELPRSGPFKLHEGRRAFDQARRAMKTALDRPIEDDLVHL